MNHFEELESCFFGSGFDDAGLGAIAEVVDAGVLVVESFVQDTSSKTEIREHAFDEGFEFDESMV